MLVHTGQNYDYELNQIFFDDLELRKPDHFLDAAGATAAETIGNVIIARRRGAARGAARRGADPRRHQQLPGRHRRPSGCKIPVFHMEAGNRCFDQRVPEEINRQIVDHISDINLPYSDISREYLLREGLPPDRVIKTGSPMYEVLHHYAAKIEASRRAGAAGPDSRATTSWSARTARRTSTSDRQFAKLVDDAATAGRRRYGLPVIVSTHPRTRKRIDADGRRASTRWCELLKPLGLQRLREAADARPRRALRQRHDHRGVVDPELPGAEHPRGPRAAGGDGGGGGDDDRAWSGSGSREGLAHPGDAAARAPSALLRLVADYSVPNVSEKVVRSSSATRTT